jgi:hypothetical protein
MDSKEKLWLSRGEALGRILSGSQRVRPRLVENRPAENRSAIDRFADPLEAARFSASIALAMRNGSLCNAKDLRAEAMRAGFRWLVRAVKRRSAARPLAAPMPAPVPIRRSMRKGR